MVLISNKTNVWILNFSAAKDGQPRQLVINPGANPNLDPDVVELALKAKVKGNPEGMSDLTIAVRAGHIKIVESEKKADEESASSTPSSNNASVGEDINAYSVKDAVAIIEACEDLAVLKAWAVDALKAGTKKALVAKITALTDSIVEDDENED